MLSPMRSGFVAFAMAATAVVIISVALLLAVNRGGGDNTVVGDAASVTPAVLGSTATPFVTP